MGKRFFKNRKAGFTTSEVLAAVAVLAILIGITVVSVSAIQKKLTQKELDSKAQLIYVAAQNRLTQLKAAGQDEIFCSDDIDKLTLTNGDNQLSLCYVIKSLTSGTSNAADLLPNGYVENELWDNQWVIEYDPVSATAYAVFYSEADTDIGYNGQNRESLVNQAIEKNAVIGYYCGSSDGTLPPALETDTLSPYISIENGEDLIATVSCPAPKDTSVSVSFNITVYDEGADIKDYPTDTYTPTYDSSAGLYTYELILDRLSGSALDRFGSKYINCKPGNNVVIAVEAVPTGTNKASVDSYKVSAITNSLFDSIERDSEGNVTAIVKTGRHLQNLDSDTTKIKISHVLQASDINWGEYYPSRNFLPLTNPDIETYSGAISDDETAVIYNLTVDSSNLTGVSGGLFDSFNGTSIDSLFLCGTKINGGNAPAGALIGSFSGQKTLAIGNCRVYLDEDELSEAGKTYRDVWINGSSAGGLIGSVLSGTVNISDCFASTVLGNTGTPVAGGLVGNNSGALNITGSYSDCYVTARKTGGLVGNGNVSSITSSYSVGYLTGLDSAAGLVNGNVGTIADSYTAVYFTDNSTGTAYAVARSAGTATNDVYYLASGNSTASVGKHMTKNLIEHFTATLGGKFSIVSATQYSVEYELMGKTIPDYIFPVVSDMPHYGDWEFTIERGKLVYYEVYSDNSYGYFAEGINSLKASEPIGDGYGLIFDDEPIATLKINGQTCSQTKTVSLAGNKTGYFYAFPKAVVNPASSPVSFYSKISVLFSVDLSLEGGRAYHTQKEYSYFCNPLYAKTATQYKTDTECTRAENAMQQFAASIRTPRHLYNLSRYYSNYGKMTSYTQELNLNYSNYSWTGYATNAAVSSQGPIGVNGFADNYNGGSYTINGITAFTPSGDCTGLFGKNNGIIRNVILVGKNTYSINSNDSLYAAVFSGLNSGTISNCSVSGYSLVGNSVYTGGFVGINQGNISNCSSVTASLSGNGRIGGFAGSNTSTIQNSYAISVVSSEVSTRGGFAGENSGTISNSYSGTMMKFKGGAGFTTGGTVNGCYYLNNGTYTYLGNVYSCVYEHDSRVTALTYSGLKNKSISGFERVSASNTFNASDTSSEEAYPFPAVVTDITNRVHYGDWPVAVYKAVWEAQWNTSPGKQLSLDILKMDSDTISVKLNCSADTLTESNFTVLSTSTPASVVLQTIGEIQGYDNGQVYNGKDSITTYREILFKIQNTGSANITASIGGETDAFAINLTADIVAYTDTEEIEVKEGHTEAINLYAMSGDGTDYSNRSDLYWQFTYGDSVNTSSEIAQMVSTTSGYSVLGLSVGEETIFATACIAKNGQTYTSNTIQIHVTVKQNGIKVTYFGHEDGALYTVQNCPDYTDIATVGQRYEQTVILNNNGNVSFEGISVTVDGNTLDGGYELSRIGRTKSYTVSIDPEFVTGDIEIHLFGNHKNENTINVTFLNQNDLTTYSTDPPGRGFLSNEANPYAVIGQDYVAYINIGLTRIRDYKNVEVKVGDIVLTPGVDYSYEKVDRYLFQNNFKLTIFGSAITGLDGDLTIEPKP